jgi:hypothetical protein
MQESAVCMSPKVGNGGASLPLKSSAFIHSIALHSQESGRETTDDSRKFDLEGAINLAMSRSGVVHKEMAACQGIDASQWSKAVRGQEGHISLGRLLHAPHAFWDEFLPLLCAHFGIAATSSNGVSQSVARCLIAMADVIGRLELVSDSNQKVSGL